MGGSAYVIINSPPWHLKSDIISVGKCGFRQVQAANVGGKLLGDQTKHNVLKYIC